MWSVELNSAVAPANNCVSHKQAFVCRHVCLLATRRQSERHQQVLAGMLVQPRCSAASTLQGEASTSSSEQPGLNQRPVRHGKPQTCDFSVLAACVAEMRQHWVPAKIDQVRSFRAAEVMKSILNICGTLLIQKCLSYKV